VSRGQALVALLLLLAAFFAPRLLGGEVVYPHDDAVELGLPEPVPPSRVENRWLSDVSSVYVPELALEARGERTGWLSTWNPHVELGRPTMQISGLGRAWPITRILLWLSHDEAKVFTWLSFLTLAGIAVFAFFLLDALGLHPAACLASAALLALGVYPLFWAGFVMYLAGPCWTLAFLAFAVRFLRGPRFGTWIGMAFAVYALLATAYAQLVVWEAYLAGGFLLHRVLSVPGLRGRRIRALVPILAAAVAGLACAAPILADVAVQAARSSRGAVDAAYFLKSIPDVGSARDLTVFLAQVFDVSWIGNPNDPSFPVEFRWISLAPVACGLLLAAPLDGGWRKSAYWIAFAAVGLLLTVWRGAYLFGVAHLGLGFSRFTPIAAATIPIAVLVGTTLDRWLRDGVRSRWATVAAAIAGPALAALALPGSGLALDRTAIAASVAFALALAALVAWRKPGWIVALALVAAFLHGRPVLLTRPESAIRTTSPLVERIREETRGGLRYAIVGFEDERLLPPNQEIRLGLRSIHSYDPLSARAYGEWVERVSETGTRMYGRQFRRIASDSRLGSPEVRRAGIALLLSRHELSAPGFEDAGTVGGVRLYRAKERPRLEEQVDGEQRLAVQRTRSADDRLEFTTTSSPTPTVLVVGQQYHPHWTARGADGVPLETLAVDGFWQGVKLPAGTRSVDLEFRPWVRFAWIPQALFALAAAALLAARLLRAR
jgi:hypothetical protein